MSLPEFKVARPKTLEAALDFLAQHAAASEAGTPRRPGPCGGVEIIAGGTDVIPSMRQRLFEPEFVLDIRGIAALRGIRELPNGDVEIGALTTLSEIERSSLIRERYPVLWEAARTVASPVIRNMATIGGNICLDTRCLWYNQSLQWRKSCGFCIKKDGDLCHVAPGGTKCWAAFSADTPPALLCLDARIEICSGAFQKHPDDQREEGSLPSRDTTGQVGIPRSARDVSYATRALSLQDFYTNEGDARMRLTRGEILTRMILPAATANWRGAYRKLRVRGSIDYPLASVAVVLQKNGHIRNARIALTGVNPAPVLLKAEKLEALLTGKPLSDEIAAAVGELAARTAKPLTTSALTPEYRREMVRVFAKRALMAVAL